MGRNSRIRSGAVLSKADQRTPPPRTESLALRHSDFIFDTLRQIAKKPLHKEKFDVLLTAFFTCSTARWETLRVPVQKQALILQSTTIFIMIYCFFRRNENSLINRRYM